MWLNTDFVWTLTKPLSKHSLFVSNKYGNPPENRMIGLGFYSDSLAKGKLTTIPVKNSSWNMQTSGFRIVFNNLGGPSGYLYGDFRESSTTASFFVKLKDFSDEKKQIIRYYQRAPFCYLSVFSIE